MERYFFHICNGNGFTEDEEGLELADEEAARREAYRGARDVMAADVQRGELDLSSFIEVENHNHELLFTLMFQDALDLTKRHRPAREAQRPT
jgi:hypothetical protein